MFSFWFNTIGQATLLFDSESTKTKVTKKTELYSMKLTLAHKLFQDSQPLD